MPKQKQTKARRPKTKPKTNGVGRPVIVCTDKRGVFFGYAKSTKGDPITLQKARMCIYWSVDVKGLPGLADGGPTAGCRVSPPIPAVELRGIHAILDVSADAVKAWEGAPWQK